MIRNTNKMAGPCENIPVWIELSEDLVSTFRPASQSRTEQYIHNQCNQRQRCFPRLCFSPVRNRCTRRERERGRVLVISILSRTFWDKTMNQGHMPLLSPPKNAKKSIGTIARAKSLSLSFQFLNAQDVAGGSVLSWCVGASNRSPYQIRYSIRSIYIHGSFF